MIQRKSQFRAKKSLTTVKTIYNKISKPKFGTCVAEPMSELSELIYIKSHTTLHMKSNAENVDGMLRASLFDGSKQILNFSLLL